MLVQGPQPFGRLLWMLYHKRLVIYLLYISDFFLLICLNLSLFNLSLSIHLNLILYLCIIIRLGIYFRMIVLVPVIRVSSL